MSDPERIVEEFDCNYHVGSAVKALLEHARQAKPSPKRLLTALRHVLLELRRQDPDLAPETQARERVAQLDHLLPGFVAELRDLSDKDAARAIEGLVITAIRNALEDLGATS